MNVAQIHRVAIVGTGIMGTGIALAFARAGYPVTAIDTRQDSLDRARTTLRVACDELVRGGLLRSDEAGPVLERVLLTLGGDEALSSADYVTEAVPEILDLKQQVFERCGILCRAGTVVASNTSTMRISEIAARMQHPERAVVTHWFIPPHVMPVVEVVPGAGTSEQAVQLAKSLLQKVGKLPVVCKESPGFIHNYVQLAMTRAAMLLVERGICSAEDVDTVVTNGFALRLAQLGPIRSVDYAGLETALHALQYIHEKTGDAAFQPPPILKEKVAKGELGLKSGKGFYSYSSEEALKFSALANEVVIRAVSRAV